MVFGAKNEVDYPQVINFVKTILFTHLGTPVTALLIGYPRQLHPFSIFFIFPPLAIGKSTNKTKALVRVGKFLVDLLVDLKTVSQ